MMAKELHNHLSEVLADFSSAVVLKLKPGELLPITIPSR